MCGLERNSGHGVGSQVRVYAAVMYMLMNQFPPFQDPTEIEITQYIMEINYICVDHVMKNLQNLYLLY